ncbi:MAG: glutamate racemase [Bacteroidales bacterium]|nr:glutamate racemase [Bacteroidales bacterium]MBR4980648.1 glutamate racemase [Bacteroidales bacterium]
MIGIFDSGAGGLSVWKELITIMPSEDYYYISDAEYCPYGPKCKEIVEKRAETISSYLINKGAEIIVVACNTATAAAISHLRQTFDTPFVGMEPAVKPAAQQTKSGVIGVLATQGTFKGELYHSTSEKYAKNKQVKIIEKVGEGLVELVEQGKTQTPEAEALVRKYVESMIEEGADCVVLGCTHYPFLTPVIEKVAANRLKIINPAPAVAKRAKEVLAKVREKNGGPTKRSDLFKEGNIIATTGEGVELLGKMSKEIIAEIERRGVLTEKELNNIKREKVLTLKL